MTETASVTTQAALAEPTTLAALPRYVVNRFPRRVLVRRCRERGFDDFSAADWFDGIRDLSLGLQSLGIEHGDRVAIVSESRPEWVTADLAILGAAAISVPVYPTLAAGQIRYILQDAGARVAIVSDDRQTAKIQEVRHLLPQLEAVLVMGDPAAPRPKPGTSHPMGASVLWLASVEDRGRALRASDPSAESRYDERVNCVTPDSLATIIYTSGTTGEPKGVMLSHRNIVSNIVATRAVLKMRDDDVALSFLPLSHIFERMVVLKYLCEGVTVAFAETLDTIPRDLLKVRPTIMTGVPRVYEKLHQRIHDAVAQSAAPRRALFNWAIGIGMAKARAVLYGAPTSRLFPLQHPVADRLVFAKIRERLGGRLRFVVSGSAPLPRALGEFFFAVGLPIVEGYGLTETSPVLTVNPLEAPRFGTVGRPIPGVEIRIADDGEILARGPNIMLGYWRKPEETAAVLRDGWFHTGDIGTLSEDGFLTITDRKKDLIVTSGGKKVAPQPIETMLKGHPLIAEAMVVGERRRFPAALIVPDFPRLEARLKALGRPLEPRETLVRREDVVRLYDEIVEALNRDLAQYERIKRVILIPREFTIEQGELTPSMKIRRRVVEERWRDAIESCYANAVAPTQNRNG